MLRVELENEKRIALELYGERESIIHKVTDVLQSMIADLKHVFPTWNFYVEPKLASVDSPQPYKNKYEHKNHYKIQSVVSVSLTARCSTYQAFQQYSNSETLMLCTVYFNRYGRLFVVSSHGDRHNCYVSDVFESHELIRVVLSVMAESIPVLAHIDVEVQAAKNKQKSEMSTTIAGAVKTFIKDESKQ